MKNNKLLPYLQNGRVEAGCDEAGRGCLAGPVFAAAVILPENFENNLLNDSKKLSEKQRYDLRNLIEEQALAYAIGVADHHEIDRINILNASILAMHRAVMQLPVNPDHLLVDGNRFKPFRQISHTTIIGGDGKFLSIAAASILAKTYRDDFMNVIHGEFPMYQWNRNKGYPTLFHRTTIQKFGISPYHRRSFANLDQIKLEF
jgi:ribonuclease HII